TQLVQPAAQPISRNRNTTLKLQLRRKRRATPARATPPESRGCFAQQSQQRATQGRRQRAGVGCLLGIAMGSKRARAISIDGAINARARAEQDASNLRRVISGST